MSKSTATATDKRSSSLNKQQLLKPPPLDRKECPFREYKDNELNTEFWGMGPQALKFAQTVSLGRALSKPAAAGSNTSQVAWRDEQTQPLPRSVMEYLHEWVRAEDLANQRWEAEVIISEDPKMSVMDMQVSHGQVLTRSSFCRKVLSTCFILERAEYLPIEHQSECFTATFGLEGWRPRCHIYSPGTKPGGGPQHRPGLSKNGCYLVRLYYLGAWRCIWVSDQVPVDAGGAPLLPFGPIITQIPSKPKQLPTTHTASVIHLWPLLFCKAMLKLAAPNMSQAEENFEESMEDDECLHFDMFHALTGSMSQIYHIRDPEITWKLTISEVPVFTWDEDEEVQSSTIKTKSSKKTAVRDAPIAKHRAIVVVVIEDTHDCPPYALPGITPCFSMSLIVSMARDLPLKKPLPEPEIPLWKTYRWVDWARRHGLYDSYECPRTRFLKVNGLMKLSYAPHLLDVQSTESITFVFREEHSKTDSAKPSKKGQKKDASAAAKNSANPVHPSSSQTKDQLREWVQFVEIQKVIRYINVVYYTINFDYTTGTSHPIHRKIPNKKLDIVSSKTSPMYFCIDGPEENCLKISLSVVHPRVLLNCGVPFQEYIEKAHVLLEVFEWFVDTKLVFAKAYTHTRGYDSVEVCLRPGRHFCRLWIHSRTNWHVALLSDSMILLGSRDVIMCTVMRDCPWVAKHLVYIGSSFNSWIRVPRNSPTMQFADMEFYQSYQPDLPWDPEVVGYNKALIHWMFRQALQAYLFKKLQPMDYDAVCNVLRKQFCDPDFGFPPKPPPPKSLREIIARDPCDCVMPEVEEMVEEELNAMSEQMVVPDITASDSRTVPEAKTKLPKVEENLMAELLKQEGAVGLCDIADEELPCGLLKQEREKMVRMHEAATTLQAHWRGRWARHCLRKTVVVTPDVLKILNDNVFGNVEALTSLMNEFFLKYPGAKYAYSIASGLTGVYGLTQYTGVALMTPKCSWVPFFQGVFHCHASVKVHFDVLSSLEQNLVVVYDNETGQMLTKAFNAHFTYDMEPNTYGYTVMGHGVIKKSTGIFQDVNWQLTVLTSLDDMFHVCDNSEEFCNIIPLPAASKLHVDEFFLPNKKNILGGIQLAVTKVESVAFRAETSDPDLEIEAILWASTRSGGLEEVARCKGKGEIHWPYIRLKPFDFTHSGTTLISKKSYSQNYLPEGNSMAALLLKGKVKPKPNSAGTKSKSSTKLTKASDRPVPAEPKMYIIEVVAPDGWPLSIAQWKKVDEVRNMQTVPKIDVSPSKKSAIKAGATSAKEKKAADKTKPEPGDKTYHPGPDDAYTVLECSTAVGGGNFSKRDDRRFIEYMLVTRNWESKQPGRNLLGAQIRQEFREEFLSQPYYSKQSMHDAKDFFDEMGEEELHVEDSKKIVQIVADDSVSPAAQPTPVTAVSVVELGEEEEESLYLTMPEVLRDKFIPLFFVAQCTKELDPSGPVLLTPELRAALENRSAEKKEAALELMQKLQEHNEHDVLGPQKIRTQLLETLLIDGSWGPDILAGIQGKADAIAVELAEAAAAIALKKKETAKKAEMDTSNRKKKK